MRLVVDTSKVGLFEGDRLVYSGVVPNLEKFLEGKTIEKGLIVGSALPSVQFPCQLLPSSEKPLIYGAVKFFPVNDCVVVDVSTTVQFHLITRQGKTLGGSQLFLGNIPENLPPALGHTLEEQKQSGSFFGLLGAIERIVSELRLSAENPMSVMAVATGSLTHNAALRSALEEFVDKVEPDLTLIGMNEILKEENV